MDEMRSCGCIGPQNGQPKCPCIMRGVVQRDGRWIQQEVDLGPVQNTPLPNEWAEALSRACLTSTS